MVDVGGHYNPALLNFDHHQNDDALCWKDGLPYSSCGLVCKWLRETKKLHQHMNEETMDIIERDLIRRVDKHDNGIETMSELIFLIMFVEISKLKKKLKNVSKKAKAMFIL